VIEKGKHAAAFEAYFAMGPSRSLTRLAKQLGVSTNTTKHWSKSLRWQDRISERERQVTDAVAGDAIQEAVSTHKRNKKLLQLALAQVAKQIAEGRVRATISDLDKLLRLELLLAGEADSRQEVVMADLQGKSPDELRALLRREMVELQELVDLARLN
jgi:hypothetical protein